MRIDDLYRVHPPRPWARWGAAFVISAVVAVGAARAARPALPSEVPARVEADASRLDAVAARMASALDRIVRP